MNRKTTITAETLAFTKPMSLAYCLKHWRHMLSPYLRIRPCLLAHTRLHGTQQQQIRDAHYKEKHLPSFLSKKVYMKVITKRAKNNKIFTSVKKTCINISILRKDFLSFEHVFISRVKYSGVPICLCSINWKNTFHKDLFKTNVIIFHNCNKPMYSIMFAETRYTIRELVFIHFCEELTLDVWFAIALTKSIRNKNRTKNVLFHRLCVLVVIK